MFNLSVKKLNLIFGGILGAVLSTLPFSLCFGLEKTTDLKNPSMQSNHNQSNNGTSSNNAVNNTAQNPSSNHASNNTTNSNSVNSAKISGFAERNLKASQLYLEENKKKPGMVTLPSGLQYQVLKEGAGQAPGPSDFVAVHYRGTLLNGQEFDSSHKSKQPATFAVNAVIPGWTEALQLMKPGAKWMIYVPPQLAYGEKGIGSVIAPNSALIFEVDLLSVKKDLDDTKDGVVEDWEGLD